MRLSSGAGESDPRHRLRFKGRRAAGSVTQENEKIIVHISSNPNEPVLCKSLQVSVSIYCLRFRTGDF